MVCTPCGWSVSTSQSVAWSLSGRQCAFSCQTWRVPWLQCCWRVVVPPCWPNCSVPTSSGSAYLRAANCQKDTAQAWPLPLANAAFLQSPFTGITSIFLLEENLQTAKFFAQLCLQKGKIDWIPVFWVNQINFANTKFGVACWFKC